MLQLLLEHEADPNIEDIKGRRPIDWADQYGVCFEILEARIPDTVHNRLLRFHPSELFHVQMSLEQVVTNQSSSEWLTILNNKFRALLGVEMNPYSQQYVKARLELHINDSTAMEEFLFWFHLTLDVLDEVHQSSLQLDS